jgi:hypothetical protein
MEDSTMKYLHTPGTWQADEETDYQPARVLATGGPPRFYVVADVYGESRDARTANANLMAAAPDLLAAARAALVLLEALSEQVNRGERTRDVREERNALRLAIAKAEDR